LTPSDQCGLNETRWRMRATTHLMNPSSAIEQARGPMPPNRVARHDVLSQQRLKLLRVSIPNSQGERYE
jgi:hypothetical protein